MDHSQMKHIMTPEGMVMIHQGVPGWLFAVGVGAVILLSFIVIERFGLASASGWRLELTKNRYVRKIIGNPWFRLAFQLPVLAMFLAVIYVGLFGNYARNLAPVLTWTVWWAGLIFGVALLGNAWCFMCPWDLLSNIGRKLSMGYELPKWLRNVYPATFLFIVITWAELGWGITNNPRQTAVLGALMAFSAVGMALVFEKKAFCRSVCMVGRTSGMYSMFSPIEIRARDTRVCDNCTTHACLNGSDAGYGCPTGIDMSEHSENTYCTLCTECFNTCPALIPTVRVRPFGVDIPAVKDWRKDEAVLALTLLALTGFHGLSMTPVWQNFEPGTTDIVGLLREGLALGQVGAFTVGMIGIFFVPFVVYGLLTALAWLWVRPSGVGYEELFVAYAYSLLPVALFYHLAHNSMHLFMEGQQVIPLFSDPMGTGADWFGTATWHLGPLLSMEAVWYMQVVLVVIGHLFGVTVAHRISRRLFDDPAWASRSLIPMTAMMVTVSVAGLWLMSLDMNMRGRM